MHATLGGRLHFQYCAAGSGTAAPLHRCMTSQYFSRIVQLTRHAAGGGGVRAAALPGQAAVRERSCLGQRTLKPYSPNPAGCSTSEAQRVVAEARMRPPFLAKPMCMSAPIWVIES